MPKIRQLDLDLFQYDNDIQTREVLDYEPLDLFRQLYRDEGPDALPPVVVFHDVDDVYWLADGYYRVFAAHEALSKEGPRALPAEVHEGTKRDAILYAAGANAKHGQPLYAHEKRTVVQRLLKDPEWQQWSDRQIARHTGTSHVFVGGIRKQLELEAVSGNDYQMPMPAALTRTVQRGDKRYQMHVGAIGRAGGLQPTTATDSVSTSAASTTEEDGMEAVVTQGLDKLRQAWKAATPAARHTFREWVLTQPIEDYAAVATTEQTQHYSTVIAEVCKTDVS